MLHVDVRSIRWMVLFAAVLGVLMTPAVAGAAVPATYVGWGVVTPAVTASTSTVAWEWTGAATGWRQDARRAGKPIYVQPFATGWVWTWTSAGGWRAMRSVDVSGPGTGRDVGARLPISYDRAGLAGTVLYVSITGRATGTGSVADPLPSLGAALAKVAAGARVTIVVRGGTYREGSLSIPAGRSVRIIAYPGEVPVFDGAQDLATGWTTSGAVATHAYTAMPVTDGSGISFTTGQGLAGDGIGKRPDQVWVGARQLRQVSSVAAVVSGTFHVDAAAGRLTLAAADVARGGVAASRLRKFMDVSGSGSSIEGVRIMRYSNTASDYGTLQVGGAASSFVLRDVEILDSAFQAINLSGGSTAATVLKSPVLENVTIAGANWMGIASTFVDGLVIRSSLLLGANQFDEFTNAPQSGALKTSRNRGTRVVGNVIANNHNSGLWFDQSNVDVEVAGNMIIDNGGSAVFYEISDDLLLINNHIRTTSSKSTAVKLAGSSGLKIVSNTIVGGAAGVGVFTDSRSIAGCADVTRPICASSMSSDRDGARPRPATLDWIPRLDLMIDNIIINPTGGTMCNAYTTVCVTTTNASATVPISTIIHRADAARGIPQTRIDGNVYVNDTYPAHVIFSSPLGNHTTPAAFATAMAGAPVSIGGFDASSLSGTGWVTTDGAPTAALAARHGGAVATPVDAEINRYVAAGTRRYGRIG